MANSKGNYRKDYVTPIESYLGDFKPYHSKVAEVLTIYTHSDNVNVSIVEDWHFTIGLNFDKSIEAQSLICDDVGWSVSPFGDVPYDEPFLCADFPSTILYVTVDDQVTFHDGSIIELHDNVITVFNNEHTPFSQQLQLFEFDGVVATANVIGDSSDEDVFFLSGDHAWRLPHGTSFDISGAGTLAVNGTYTVDVAFHDNSTGESITRVTVQEDIPFNSSNFYTATFSSVTMREYLNSIGQADDVFTWDGFGNNGFDAIIQPTLNIYTSLLPSSDDLNLTISDDITGSLPTAIDNNSVSGEAQSASFTETLMMAVTHLYLEENMSMEFGSDVGNVGNVGTVNHGAFLGSWDMNFWDIGSFDETEEVAVLNSY